LLLLDQNVLHTANYAQGSSSLKIAVFWDVTLCNDMWLAFAETKAIEPNHINLPINILALIRERNDVQK
jgi:hypothetical protein